MTICTSFLSGNHPKTLVKQLKNGKHLPFSEVLTKDDLSRHMKTMTCRNRIFTPEVTLWAFLSQVMDEDHSQQAAVARVLATAIAQGNKAPSANTSAYSQARSRLSEASLATLTREVAKQIELNAPSEWLWNGKRVKLVDGSTLSMPDTLKNQEEYPQIKSQKAGVGFPIARIVAVIDYSTGVVLDFAMGQYSGKQTGEHALLRQLMSSFNSDDVMLGDCYYPSFFLMAKLIELGVSGVFPAHASRKYDFRRGKRLGKKDHIARWKKPVKPIWMEQIEYDQFAEEILIREVEIEQQRPGFRTTTRVLVTTFLDPVAVSKLNLATLYGCRWFVELAFRSIKDTMHMDILRGKTPGMVRKEIWVHLLAYNLIRKIMAQAACLYETTTNTVSFKLALQTIKAFQQAGLLNSDDPDVYLKLLEAIMHKKIGNRSGRQEPRCVKRRQKPFARLQKPRESYRNAA